MQEGEHSTWHGSGQWTGHRSADTATGGDDSVAQPHGGHWGAHAHAGGEAGGHHPPGPGAPPHSWGAENAVPWLADSPAERHWGAPSGGSAAHLHGGGGDTGMGFSMSDTARVWLRTGNEPQRSPSASGDLCQTALRVLDIAGHVQAARVVAGQGGCYADVKLPEQGFYAAYLSRSEVRNEQLIVDVGKAELLRGAHSQKGVNPRQEIPVRDATQPIELIRDHLPDEKLSTRLVSGDTLRFTVLQHGRPAAGARVTLVTQGGWQKALTSDQAGHIEFTLIRDSFPPWNRFSRAASEKFLVVARLETPEGGNYQGQAFSTTQYRTSLPGKFFPTPYDYRSYAFGLGLVLGIVVFTGIAVYLYRRRRVKPFPEVRFSEGN